MVGEFAGIRVDKTIVDYLPQECKDLRHVIAADRSNEAQAKTKKEKDDKKTAEHEAEIIERHHKKTNQVPGPGKTEQEQEEKEEKVITFILEAKSYFINTINNILQENPKVAISVNMKGSIVSLEGIKQGQAAASPAL